MSSPSEQKKADLPNPLQYQRLRDCLLGAYDLDSETRLSIVAKIGANNTAGDKSFLNGTNPLTGLKSTRTAVPVELYLKYVQASAFTCIGQSPGHSYISNANGKSQTSTEAYGYHEGDDMIGSRGGL